VFSQERKKGADFWGEERFLEGARRASVGAVSAIRGKNNQSAYRGRQNKGRGKKFPPEEPAETSQGENSRSEGVRKSRGRFFLKTHVQENWRGVGGHVEFPMNGTRNPRPGKEIYR